MAKAETVQVADDLNNHVTNSHFWHKIQNLAHIPKFQFSEVHKTGLWGNYYFRVVTDLQTLHFPQRSPHAGSKLDPNWLKSKCKVLHSIQNNTLE
jgi:hypothetical protein